MTRHILLSILLVFLTAEQFQGEASAVRPDVNQETRLANDLFHNYDPRIKPTVNGSSQIVVNFEIALSKVEDLNAETELLTSHGYLLLTWHDELLRWNPADYNGIYELVVTSDSIWLPEILVKNSADSGNDIALNGLQQYRVLVFYNGFIRWSPPMTWVTTCKMSVYYFPFDQQTCQVVFTNSMYINLLNFTLASPDVNLAGFHDHSEWLLISSSTGRRDIDVTVKNVGDTTVTVTLPELWFTIVLSRTPQYYLVNVLLISAILTAVCLFMFAIPSHAEEKVVIGVTLLLAYAVILLIVNDATPRSRQLPLAMIIVCFEILLCLACTLCAVIVLRVHEHPPIKPIPRWAKNFFIKKLAGRLCITVVKEELDEEDEEVEQPPRMFPKRDDNNHLMKPQSADGNGYETGENKLDIQHDIRELLQEVKKHFRIQKKLLRNNEKHELYEAEWRDLARVLDTIFLIFWTIVFAISHLFLYLCLYGNIQSAHITETDDLAGANLSE